MSDPMDYDAELRLHNEVLRRACDIRRHDRVLDIGCGAGQTTRDAARIAAAGNAVGVDISAGMIARAQVLTDAEGLRNVRFEQADAQVHRTGTAGSSSRGWKLRTKGHVRSEPRRDRRAVTHPSVSNSAGRPGA